MRTEQFPSYRRQHGRSSDRAYICPNGRRHYPGEYGS